MDVLAAVMRELQFAGAGYRRLELRAPWAISFGQHGMRGVHIVLSGRCEAAFDDGPVQALGPGDLVIAPRGDPHVLRSANARRIAPTASSKLTSLNDGGQIRFGGAGEETVILCGAFLFREADHPALAGLPRFLHAPGVEGQPARWLRGYVDALLTEAFDEGPGSDVVLARLSAALVTRALRHGVPAGEPGWLNGLRDPALAKALAAIHDDCAKPWTIELLARRAGLSRAAFAARFHQAVGEPPMRYLFLRRMRQAGTLLGSGKPLAQIAAAVGYGSEAAFSAAFKRHTGLSPGEFRRRAADPPGRKAAE